MTNPSDLRESSNDECKSHSLYDRFFYEAMGFLSGITHERRNNELYDSNNYWSHGAQWCDYYASYCVRSIIHKHDPVSISHCYDIFITIELPRLRNAAATTPCEVDNGS